jgi:hypothetical protein
MIFLMMLVRSRHFMYTLYMSLDIFGRFEALVTDVANVRLFVILGLLWLASWTSHQTMNITNVILESLNTMTHDSALWTKQSS